MNVGTRVRIEDRDGSYYGEEGTVVRKEQNLLGDTLIIVQLDNSTSNYQPCFYPGELVVLESPEETCDTIYLPGNSN